MNQIEWDEYVDKYVAMYRKSLDSSQWPRRPKHLRPGVSWTTREHEEHHKQMDNILEEIQLDALRTFIKEVNKRLDEGRI